MTSALACAVGRPASAAMPPRDGYRLVVAVAGYGLPPFHPFCTVPPKAAHLWCRVTGSLRSTLAYQTALH
jgi:hypothetical protein